jgi:hypothetical protein
MKLPEAFGDRLPMKVWSWLGVFNEEVLCQRDPTDFAVGLAPELFDRFIVLGRRVAHWLLAVADAVEVMKRKAEDEDHQTATG